MKRRRAGGHIVMQAGAIEVVRIRLDVMMRERGMTREEVADRVGRDVAAVHKFLERSGSSAVALAVVLAWPAECGEGVICPGCGRPVHGPERKEIGELDMIATNRR